LTINGITIFPSGVERELKKEQKTWRRGKDDEVGGRVGGGVGRTRQNVSIFIGTFRFSGSG